MANNNTGIWEFAEEGSKCAGNVCKGCSSAFRVMCVFWFPVGRLFKDICIVLSAK